MACGPGAGKAFQSQVHEQFEFNGDGKRQKKQVVVRKERGAIIAEVLQLWPADLDAITVMPPVKKLK